MFISKASSSLVIQSDHILQAHQIYDYSHEHENTSKITAAVRELIRYIILTYSEKSQKTSSRNILRSRSVKFTKYFEDWIITKSARQAAFRKFKEQINHYRQHSIFLKYLHTRHSERSIRSDHDKDIDRERIELVNEKFFRSVSQRKEESSISIMTSEIQNAINETIRQYVAANPSISEFAEFSEFAELSVSAVSFENSKWNAFEVEFFDSLYDEKSINIEQVMKHAKKNTYFRNVHFFIERIKDIAIIQDEQHVRDNLFTCLKDFALQWYISKISIEVKQLMRYDDAIDHWTTQLFNRFKKSINVFMSIILKEKYTMKDARRHKKSREYAAIILRATRSTDLESIANQIIIIYNEFDIEFQRDLTKPSNVLSLNSFFRNIDDCKEIWWQLTARRETSRRYLKSFKNRRNTYQKRQHTSYNAQNSSRYNAYQNQKSYTSHHQYQSYQSTQSHLYQSKDRAQSQLQTSKQSLAITNSITVSSATQSVYSNRYSDQSTNRYENENRQNRQKAYQITVKDEKNDQSMKENTSAANFADFDEHKNELYYEKQKCSFDHDEVFIDFVDLKTTCKHCFKVFASNNKLHHHLRHDQCSRKKKSIVFKVDISKTETSSSKISTKLKIVDSTASIKNLNFDIDFRNWNFLKALIKLFDIDSDIHVCINTECEITLEDKKFVKEKCLDIKVHTITFSLRVRNIDAITHEINEYVKMSIYFSKTK